MPQGRTDSRTLTCAATAAKSMTARSPGAEAEVAQGGEDTQPDSSSNGDLARQARDYFRLTFSMSRVSVAGIL